MIEDKEDAVFLFGKKKKAKTKEPIVVGRYFNDGFEVGYPLWEKGEAARKKGELDMALRYFKEAKQKGYMYPALYESMALTYRKQGDIKSEIAIIETGIKMLTKYGENIGDPSPAIKRLSERLEKAKALKKK